jgi:hypothetical protein
MVSLYFLEVPFFWDSVQLASKQAHFFYENGFDTLILPNEIDSGHPPFFGVLLSLAWMVFGKTMAASHLLIVPFAIGSLFLAFQLGKLYLENEVRALFFPLLLLVDPVLGSQSIMVSPDVLLVFGFLLTWFGIKASKSVFIIVGVIFLGLISMRGMMCAAGLFFFSLFPNFQSLPDIKTIFKKLIPFLPGGIIGIGFLVFHFTQTGWIGFHPESPWAESFTGDGLAQIPKNAIILMWRMADFGRVALLLVIGSIFGWYIFKQKAGKMALQSDLFPFLILLSLFLLPSFLMYKGLTGHRYLLPLMLVTSLIFLKTLEPYNLMDFILVNLIVVASLIGGNWWVYPDKMAQGWDATLGHVPYYSIRSELIQYLKDNNISPTDIGVEFPMIGSFEIHELNGKNEGFSKFDPLKSKFALFTNIINQYSDEQILEFKSSWEPLKTWSSPTVHMTLYKNPNAWNGGN